MGGGKEWRKEKAKERRKDEGETRKRTRWHHRLQGSSPPFSQGNRDGSPLPNGNPFGNPFSLGSSSFFLFFSFLVSLSQQWTTASGITLS